MKFNDIYSLVGDVPFITKDNAKRLYELIIERKVKKILELGIAHGTATCIMAAALEENGGGEISCVDLIDKKDHYQPSIEQQLLKAGLTQYVKISRMQSGYTWFLHDEIKRNTKNDVCSDIYDLCIIDGPKNWTIDGAAFFMVDKLLKSNGMIIFDDYHWSYSQVDKKRDATDGITHRTLSESELITPQIQDVFELLVKQHPNYGNFTLHGDSGWAIAEKINSNNKNYKIIYSENTKDVVAKFIRIVHRKLRDYL